MSMGRACLLAAAVIVAVAAAAPGRAGAQPPRSEPAGGAVALLPLDAAARLEIYGQAVATEIARALTAGGVEVVVVGANMDIPAAARLIVDGRLAADKGVVTLSMRVRRAADNAELDTLSATAPSLAQIDKAAADLAARMLLVARARLGELARAGGDRPGTGPVGPPSAAARPVLVGIASFAGAKGEPLRAALAGAVEEWVRGSRREPRIVEPRTIVGPLAPKAVASENAERAVSFAVLGYSVDRRRDVPLARARVRVRISDASGVLFDRIVATDTIVGERQMAAADVAARAAQEVLAILRPHVQRAVAPWP